MTVQQLPRNFDNQKTWFGLASDTKPTLRPSEEMGSLFFELDTGRCFQWNGSSWFRLLNPNLPIGPMYYANIPSQVHVGAASTVHWDLFNAHASLVVRVLSILQIPDISQAVTGVATAWLLERSTAVGTGGSVITPWQADLNSPAIDAAITCRSKPTGGATQSTDLYSFTLTSEETDAGVLQIAARGGLELVPQALQPANGGAGIVLRQNQGIRHNQNTNSSAGNTGWLIGFTIE